LKNLSQKKLFLTSIKSLKIYQISKKHLVSKIKFQLYYILKDGSSYALAYLNIEEHDPPIQELVNVNQGDMKGDCPIEKFQYIRVVNFNKNAFEKIDKVISL
jgi:hypothetical protein